MSSVYRGSEQEIAERALAAQEQVARLEADLAALREHRRLLTEQLAREQKRLSASAESKGLLIGLALAMVVGPIVLVGLLVVLRAIFWKQPPP